MSESPSTTPVPTSTSASDGSISHNEHARRDGHRTRVAYSLGIYYLTSLVVFAGTAFGIEIVTLCQDHPDARALGAASFADRMAPWDGVWYRRIATDGYAYSPSQMSNVAFYPMYPCLAGAVMRVTGLSASVSLLLVSHLFLAGTFVLLASYLRDRRDLGADGIDWSLLAMGLFPTTLYFRMGYSESCFLFFILLAMYGIRRRWPLFAIALTIGAATASRSVGVAGALPFLWHLWRISPTPTAFAVRAGMYVPVCMWGIASYMAYQQYAFGDALAFVQTQVHWHERPALEGVWRNLWAWGTLEAYRDVYDPNCPCYWGKVSPRENPLFNLKFLNPVFAVFALSAVAWGRWKKWISIPEFLLSLGMLGIPYITHAYWACSSSEARYASVVFPLYIVIGYALRSAPPAFGGLLAALSGAALFAFTSLFVAWYWFY